MDTHETVINGVLPLKKPKGMTSHDCVYKIRKLFKTKKVGHTGTLDPDVEGVLPICLGRATKIGEYLTDFPKTYEGVIQLGQATTTEDASGDVIEEKKLKRSITRKEVLDVFKSFEGEINQTPPMYSAVKVKGKRLYEYAREGLEVERPVRAITIYKLELLSDDLTFMESIPFRVTASKGTYVRTLAVDIGKQLDYPAHLSYLVRTASGPFKLMDCYSFEDLEKLQFQDRLISSLFSIEYALKFMPHLTVDEQIEEKIRNGAVLPAEPFYTSVFTVYNKQGECLAIYQPHPNKPGWIKPVKILKII